VSNSLDGVHIELADVSDIKKLCDDIRANCPVQARIDDIGVEEMQSVNYDGFSIITSEKDGPTDMQVTPDFALCHDCLKELNDASNHRFKYPFITCTNCGPRFSIIQSLPYDRHLTTMKLLEQCGTCASEFHNPEDRRFYSQTNSCPECSIRLKLFNKDKKTLSTDQDNIIDIITGSLMAGQIVAIKGIGGYLLCADATSADVIRILRERKRRPAKPFALMYPDKEMAEKDVFITDKIIEDWESQESPIVLCRLKEDFSSGIHHELIAPGLKRIGIMMPYAPLYVLLMNKIKKPIIATSGNVSGSPIIFKDEEALEVLSKIADLIVVNNRDIVVPQDDSVIQYSDDCQQKIVLRRSRGMAPSFSNPALKVGDDEVLAVGAMLKSAFGIKHLNRYYISQFLGDTSTLESQISYESTLKHMRDLLDFSPSVVVTDIHPDYPSTMLGGEIAAGSGARVVKIQHHEAHSFAVLAENDLLQDDGILSVVWDGTGYGSDDQIWGGEFFEYTGFSHTRIGQWEYFPHILGDKMSLEPRISALCLAQDIAYAEPILANKFELSEFNNYKILLKKRELLASSVGRIFDGISSLLGISDFNTYEGEAAMCLEALAIEYFDRNKDFKASYDINITDNGILKTSDLIAGIISDLREGFDNSYIAAKFHVTMAIVVQNYMDHFNYQKVVFSGGVFQNNFLIDLLIKTLSDKYSVYFHKQLSPNDECIPFGQLIAYQVLND
jgi:hydrogenase maturation protein HypF